MPLTPYLTQLMTIYEVLNYINNSFVIFLAGLSLVKFAKYPATIRPFCYNLWLGALSIVCFPIINNYFHTNASSTNLFALLDFYTVGWLYYNLSGRKQSRTQFLVLFILMSLFWIIDNLFINSIGRFNSAFYIASDVTLMYLVINQINICVVSEKAALSSEPVFLISISFLIYYSFSLVFEVFYLYELYLAFSDGFGKLLEEVKMIAFIAANLLVLRALLRIKRRERLTLPFLYLK